MYTYEDIAFRPIEKEDLEVLRKLHNEKNTILQMGTVEYVSTIEQIKWWENGVSDSKNKRFAIVFAESNSVLGRLRIQNIDHINKNCEVGLDILPDYRGKGYGKKCYQMVMEFLFLQWNMHMIYLKVADFNPLSKKLYKSLGFRETGKFPECLYRYGKYWDWLIMAILRNEYFNMRIKS